MIIGNVNYKEPLVAPDADWREFDRFAYNGNDLGAAYSKERTVFKVWAPSATDVTLKLFSTGCRIDRDEQLLDAFQMERNDSNGVWSISVEKDLINTFYTFVVTVNGKKRETVDIYAKAVGINGNRGMIVDLQSTNPDGWENDRRVMQDCQTKAIIWEVHVRDFSVHPSSGVSEKNRGKYLAFTETGTTLNSDGIISTCVDYLQELGINYVHLLPVYDFGSIDEANITEESFNWGYDPKNYNVPEGSYSSNPYDGNVRINEFKQMVMALHNAGIGVVMDMVYNHTYESENSWFNRTVPKYYYRMNSDGSWSNGSGCGNDTASEHKMFRKYMVDSVMYWVQEYHLDGVRFDLMGLHDADTMNLIRENLDSLENGKKILMYGEAWDMLTAVEPGTVMASKNNIGNLSDRIAAFNDGIRDAIKGNSFDKYNRGFVQGCGHPDAMKAGITAKSAGYGWGWAKSPSQTVTYSSCHDNYSLWDKLLISLKGAETDFDVRDEVIVAMNRLAAAIVFTSQGISFMQGGEEFARNKKGEHNSYNLPASINRINWNNIKRFKDLDDYYSGLLEIRKAFAPFTDPTTASASSIRFFNTFDGHVISYTLKNMIVPDKGWGTVTVIFNSDPASEKTVYIQSENAQEEWVVIANDKSAGVRALDYIKDGRVKLPPTSAMILVDKKSFERAAVKSRRGKITVKHVNKLTDEIMETECFTGIIGKPYKTTVCKKIRVDYDCWGVLGRQNGVFTENDIEIIYYYIPCKEGVGTVIVRYLDENGTRELAPQRVVRDRKTYSYIVRTLPVIDGYELDFTRFPQNSAGVISTDRINVDYYYKCIAPENIKLYYKNSNNWDSVNAYVYGEEGRYLFNGVWPGEKMKNLGNGLWSIDLDIGENAKLCTPEVVFNYHGQQEPTHGQHGYKLRGKQITIENSQIKYSGFNGIVHVLYVTDDGKILEHDKLEGSPDTNSSYVALKKNFDGYYFVKRSGNLTGQFSTAPKYVIFTYRAGN